MADGTQEDAGERKKLKEDNIIKRVSYLSKDGLLHLSYNDAKKHNKFILIKEWLIANKVTAMSPHDVAKILINNWDMNRRK